MRPTGHAHVDSNNPSAFGVCDRDGLWYNLRDLRWQMAWSGTRLYNTGVLVCKSCYDEPNQQLRTILLPADPLPVLNARVPNFDYEEQTPRIIQFAQGALINKEYPYGKNAPAVIRATNDGNEARVLQYLTSS